MTAALIPTPVMQFLDADGNPLVGGKVYTYAAGTSTPLATYTDYGGATPNANPVILNSRGEASIWFGTAAYKLALYTSATVLIWTADNVSASTPVVYGTGVAAALAINVGTAGSILVNGGALVGTTLSASGTSTMAAINASGLVAMAAAATVGTTLAVSGTTTAAAINASGLVAMAGAATVGTTLGVSGTSTMAAINASGNLAVNTSKFTVDATTGATAVSSTVDGTPFAVTSTAGVGLRISTSNADAAARNFTMGQNVAYGKWSLKISTAAGGDPIASGSEILGATASGLAVTGTLSISSDVTITSASAYKIVTGGYTHSISQSGDTLFVNGNATSVGSAGDVRVTARAVTIGTFSSTGLSVTGTTSTTTGMAVGGATPGAGGLAFPATAVAVADANTLDDYEEGTWTPVLGGITSVTYSTQTGAYTKIGNVVNIVLYITVSGGTRNGADLAVTNLPFTSAAQGFSGGSWGYGSGVVAVTVGMPQLRINTSGTSISFCKTDGTIMAGTDLNTATPTIAFSATYRV